jgi:mRNA interferase RelE/StbE
MKQVAYTATAVRQLAKMDRQDARRIRDKIEQYATSPDRLANQIKRLQGSPFYRLRVGDYRVIFDEDGKVLTIIAVGQRREIFR